MRLLSVAIVVLILSVVSVAGAQDAEPTCSVVASSIVCEHWATASCPGGRFEVAIADPVSQIAVGAGRACAVTTSGAVWCWEPADVEEACAGVSAREVAALRGRAAGVALAERGAFVALTDGSVAAWIYRSDERRRAEPWADMHIFSSGEGRAADADPGADCAIVGTSVWCWDDQFASPLAERIAVDHPISSLRCDEGCCALGPNGEATCWGSGRGVIEGLLADVRDRVDFVWNAGGACVASEHHIECDGWLRPEVRSFVYWRGFELRGHERAVDLRFTPDDGVCLETTARTMCWGGDDEGSPRLRNVRPIPSLTRRRLMSGERALRARVSARMCEEGGGSEARDPSISAHVTAGRVRLDIDGLVSNCGYSPTIDVTLRADGTITLTPGDPPPGSPLARCECSFDLQVLVRAVPPGPHRVLFIGDDDTGAVVAEIIAR